MVTTEPDPRIPRTRHRVMAATLDLLAEGGFRASTIERIAKRSGVAKSTIYRHWTGLPPLILDSFVMINPAPPPFVPTGSLRHDLHEFLTALAGAVTGSRWGALMAPLVEMAEHDEEFQRLARDFVESRRRPLRDLLHAAQQHGQLPASADADLLAGLIGGSLFYRRLISREPLDRQFIDQLVDAFTAPTVSCGS
jgi:DNA-binding transcriptional regulator YbjK